MFVQTIKNLFFKVTKVSKQVKSFIYLIVASAY